MVSVSIYSIIRIATGNFPLAFHVDVSFPVEREISRWRRELQIVCTEVSTAAHYVELNNNFWASQINRVFNKFRLVQHFQQSGWLTCFWAGLYTQVESLCTPGWSRMVLGQSYQRF